MNFSELPDSKETGKVFVSDSRLLFLQKKKSQIFLKGKGFGEQLSQGEPEQPCPWSPSHPRVIHWGHSHCSCCLYVQASLSSAGFWPTLITLQQCHEGLTVGGGCLTPIHSNMLNQNIFFFHMALIFNILKNPVYGLCFFYFFF